MLFGTMNGTSMASVHIVICTRAGDLMNTLYILKADMDKASCKNLKDYSEYRRNGQLKN